MFEHFGRCLDRCESPLERRFLVALLFLERFGFRPVRDRGPAEIAEDHEGIVLGQQVPVGGYRVDFAMKRRGARGRLAIELDGRTFHSAPEDVERDKLRDRMLLGCGWTTARFTSKEIIQDAVGCAVQARVLAIKLAAEEAAARPALARTKVDGRGQALLVADGSPLLRPAVKSA